MTETGIINSGRTWSPRRLVLALGVGLLVLTAGMAAGDVRQFRERTGPPAHLFRLPVANPDGRLFSGTDWAHPLALIGVDHKPQPGRDDIFARAGCRDFQGRSFPHCYGNHQGSDFILNGGFAAMDRLAGRVVAAADGEVIRVEDGHYDRCRMSILKLNVSCQGHEMKPNLVEIRHPNGYVTWYFHFKKDSIVVKPGQQVKCGDFLGNVGSSGMSSMPHLHFQVLDPDGFAVDPFSIDPADSLWVEQNGPYGLPAERCAP